MVIVLPPDVGLRLEDFILSLLQQAADNLHERIEHAPQQMFKTVNNAASGAVTDVTLDKLDLHDEKQKYIREQMMSSLRKIDQYFQVVKKRDVIDAANILKGAIGVLELPPDRSHTPVRREQAMQKFREAETAAIRAMTVAPEISDIACATRLRIVSCLYLYLGLSADEHAAMCQIDDALTVLLQHHKVVAVLNEQFGESVLQSAWRLLGTGLQERIFALRNINNLIISLDCWCDANKIAQRDIRAPVSKEHFHTRRELCMLCFLVGTLRGHTTWVFSVALGGDRLYSGSADKTIMVWDVKNLKCVGTFTEHTSAVCSVAFGGDRLYSGSEDETIKVWDVKNMKCVGTLTGHTNAVRSVAFGGDRLYSGSEDKTIKVWDVKTMSCVGTLTGHTKTVWSVAFGEDRVYSGSADNTIKVWDAKNMNCVGTLTGHTNSVCSLVFGGDRIYSGSFDTTIKVWDVKTMSCVGTLTGHTNMVRSVAFGGDRIYSGSEDKTIKVWDVKNMNCVGTLTGHSKTLFSVAFGEDRLYSGSANETIKVWDVKNLNCAGISTGHTTPTIIEI